MVGAVRANMQNGRAGACTTYYSAFDPEVATLMRLKNPMSPEDKRIRGMDYAQIGNKFLGRKAARNEEVFLFNSFTAPDLAEAFYSSDLDQFVKLYNKYEQDPNFKKTYYPAREIVFTALNEGYETGRAYLAFADEINRHTPFIDPIYSSNLCAEITEPTRGYEDMVDLYTDGPVSYIEFTDTDGNERTEVGVDPIQIVEREGQDCEMLIAAQNLKEGDLIAHPDGSFVRVAKIDKLKMEPEVALCSLGGLVVSNIDTDEQYEDAAYYCLKMIDKCIHRSHYALPHIGYTAKNRLSAGVGIMGLAHHLAKKHLLYSSLEGKAEIHRVAERHAYFVIKSSLRLGKELGNAPWMHRTKWPSGWLPIDTYNRNVDNVAEPVYHYKWEELRSDIIANGGIRHSTLIAHMPGESSTKAAGTTNSGYPIRELTLIKTDNHMAIYWAAPDGERLGKYYESAWDIHPHDMIDVYAILQKFTDQSISADMYRRVEGDAQIEDTEMLEQYFYMLKMGMKTRYYQNTKTSKTKALQTEEVFEILGAKGVEEVVDTSETERGCAGGFCTL